MLRLPSTIAALFLLAGCAGGLQPTVIDTARVQPGQLGGSLLDTDVSAVQQAQWAFASPGRTLDRPVEAARAAASMDYIAGELNSSPRWSRISALTQMQLLQGRAEVRQALSIRADASSQAVVDNLSGVANALAAGNQPAALAALSAPIYTAPAPVVLATLNRLPYLQMANVSTMRAANQLFPSESSSWR
jgi:hypothetical protein